MDNAGLKYSISIDTGGTFTDLIALDNKGNSYRKKILSNGTIRGSVAKWLDDKTLQVNESWGLTKDILAGFKFRLLNVKHNVIHVLSFDIENKILKLDTPFEKPFRKAGITFELSAGEEAPVLAVRMITGTALNNRFPEIQMRLGSTKGTNALLERKGAPSVLYITKGFGDLLEIGTQQRPDIFSLVIQKKKSLPELTVEIDERIDADGEIIKPLDTEIYRQEILKLVKQGIESAAVVFLNGYKNPVHEKQLGDLLKKLGIKYVSVSHELSPLIKLLERAETTTVNAYLSPVIQEYIANITNAVNHDFLVMNSAGGLVRSDSFHPKDSLLSGPAGGVVGASSVARQSGHNNIITFDMGGTSTDVSRYSGNFDYKYELEIGDALVKSPAIAIETVAAGGGSVCGYDGFRLTVGPESAGADPGPACYGSGGPLTITDVNLMLGRMDISSFGIPVDPGESCKKLDNLLDKIHKSTGKKPKREQVLTGFLDIADEIMAGAIRKISTAKGFNPSDYVMVAFGGAGGMHACSIAELLGVSKILIPKDAGLLSAYGIGTSRIERIHEKQVLELFDPFINHAGSVFSELIRDAKANLHADFGDQARMSIDMKTLFLRFKGQDSTLAVEMEGDPEQLRQNFRKAYEKLFGHWVEDRDLEVESIRVKVSLDTEGLVNEKTNERKREKAKELRHITSWNKNEWKEVPVYLREELMPGMQLEGLAIITNDKSTVVIEEGWKLKVDSYGNLEIIPLAKSKGPGNKQDLISETELELYSNRFMSVASNMGAILQRTALSVNIKERMDFSCALLDKDGYLVTNAPHIPVHLGSLGICVRTLMKHVTIEEGDTVVTNHPFFGGSHLPDITFITPVYERNQRIAFVVNRAHHAEIGGMAPGSMPPFARTLAEEGVTIAPFHLIKKGRVNWEGIKQVLLSAPYPTRNVEENLADLNAALAANYEGLKTLRGLVADHGFEQLLKYMKRLKEYAEMKMQQVLAAMEDGVYHAEEALDDHTPIKVKVTVSGDRAVIDLTGSGAVHPQNMNATPAIVNSVVIYVMRLLLDEQIPLNDGLMEPVTLILPEGFLSPPFDRSPEECPAVVGGNVEVSQRLTDALLKAFGIAACSQGTMNNVLFGNRQFGYYETVGGGTGAVEGSGGTSAVHQHMTNTRITDPEIIEHRFPILLNRFSIRKNSGGKGKFKGGDGIIREYTFLEDMELSLLSQHRTSGPYGINGGGEGVPGTQRIIKQDGTKVPVSGIDHHHVEKGDTFILETPGGGGWGRAEGTAEGEGPEE